MTDNAPQAQPRSDASTSSPATAFAHLPALDGLRAVAVIAVVLFHTWLGTFPGGFIGVDVFFVISGFLITSLLVGEHRGTGRINLPAFWGRRVRRLAPAVVAMVVVCSIVVYLIGDGSALGLVDGVGALTWTQNWVHLAVSGSTWAQHNTNTVFDHLWSLAIEEQFYLVWPLLLLGLLRVSRRRAVHLGIVIGLIALSATLMGLESQAAAYFRTDARAFELLGGALLALSGWRPSRRVADVLAALGLIAIVVCTFVVHAGDSWLYPWGFLAATAIFAGLVASTTNPPPWLDRVMGRPAQAIGRVSYGIYLWHIPVVRIISPGRTHLPAVPLAVVRLAVLAAVVLLSYHFIEQPVRSRRWRLTPSRVALVVAVAIVALVPLGFSARNDFRHQWDASHMPTGVAAGDRVLVVGDGVATMVAKGFPSGTTWDTSDLGCGLLPGDMTTAGRTFGLDVACTHWAQRWADAVDSFRPRVVVVMESSWDLIPRADGTPNARLAGTTYRRAAAILGRHGARVAWVDPIDPSGVSPVPKGELGGRVANATALSTVIAGLPSVDAVSLDAGANAGTGPLHVRAVTAAGSRLAASLPR